jgi:F0F1-type ATP synthase membrane subunit b/b'
MDAILHALGGILLRAVPTFLLVIFLHFYLKSFFFKPFEKVLQKRYEATEGARKLAQQSLEKAAAKASEYEASVRAAKGEVYQAQEKIHKDLQEQQAAGLLAARQEADAAVKRAKAELAHEVEVAKAGLSNESDRLADQIADSILRRSAA